MIGMHVEFGLYRDNPILWKVIDVNEERMLLFSQEILTYKCFDSKERTGYTTDQDRIDYGSNRWSDSNIREWLNTSDEHVTYVSSAPVPEGVWGGFNAYDAESGFLNAFSSYEKTFIQPISLQTTIPIMDRSDQAESVIGHEFECAFPDIALRNYEEALRETTEDAVFLPSIFEIKTLVQDRGWEWAKKPTDIAIENDQSGKNYDWYWTRTVTSTDSHGVRNVSSDGYLDCRSAYRGTLGIAPIISVSPELANVLIGEGTLENPLRMKN